MPTPLRRTVVLTAVLAGALVFGACSSDSFNIGNPNQPTLDDLLNNPTRGKLSAAATGLFLGARSDIPDFVWRVGSMGREGINLANNNPPDLTEPYFGPLSPSGFGGAHWLPPYQNIRSVNVFLTALGKTTALSPAEIAAAKGVANTLKAVAFIHIIQTRGSLGAPVDVDRAVGAPPADFVREDSVYSYALGLLKQARADLATAGPASFPFPLSPGLAAFATPANFISLTWALSAKAEVLRATAGCGRNCFSNALTALGHSFLNEDPSQFGAGAYYDFSNRSGDTPNFLSEPLNGATFFAVPSIITDAQLKDDGETRDDRVGRKIGASTIDPPPSVVGVPITGQYKFAVYMTGTSTGLTADPGASIPLIKNEELILLRAEANIGLGNFDAAIADLNLVRAGSGGLPATALTSVSPKGDLITELLYNRRYSLLWEQGTRWIDARRYGRLNSIPVEVPGGAVPPRMPIPDIECSARNLASSCSPLGT